MINTLMEEISPKVIRKYKFEYGDVSKLEALSALPGFRQGSKSIIVLLYCLPRKYITRLNLDARSQAGGFEQSSLKTVICIY